MKRIVAFLRSALRKLVFVILIVFIPLCLLEGICSVLLVGGRLLEPVEKIEEARHTEYDPDLGWIHLPNLLIPDMYGPGISFRTNSQRFRNDRDFTEVPPGNTFRVICLGDSFTMGFGVKGEDTWCHQLTLLDPRIETINMGQGGYGIDQSYLWYMRDGARFKHQLLIFAFITEDFYRVPQDNFFGYGKPVFTVNDGKIVLSNVPVPKRFYRMPNLERHIQRLEQFRTYELMKSIADRFLPPPAKKHPAVVNQELQQIVSHVFGDLSRQEQAAGSSLALIYFPVGPDYEFQFSDAWRNWAEQEAGRSGISYFDFVREWKKLPPDEWNALYGKHFHFSETGNKRIAEMIYQQVIQPRLGSLQNP